jgi:hypothetical protein
MTLEVGAAGCPATRDTRLRTTETTDGGRALTLRIRPKFHTIKSLEVGRGMQRLALTTQLSLLGLEML